MWDWENYADGDMDGKFYPEDWENIQIINDWISTYNKMHANKQRR